MNAATTAAAVALAALTWPRGRRRTDRSPARRAHRRRASRRRVTAVAAISIALLCVAIGGPVHGTVTAAVLTPAAYVLFSRAMSAASDQGSITGLPLVLDLAAAVLRGGAPVSVALEQAAVAADPATAARLVQVARLLRLGAAPVEVWSGLETDERLAAVAAVSRRSAVSGVRLAHAWEQLAADLRAELRTTALARAHRAGVFAMAPLGLCFLPAFVCLGVAPDVLGIAHEVLHGAG